MSDPATLDFATIAELAPLIEARALSPVELTEALLKRIEDPPHGALVGRAGRWAAAKKKRDVQVIERLGVLGGGLLS